ncbi:MAG: tetratricopeptide repeat protein [Ignavibacteria bacterium]|nr:tetratricopeptide repeat protein [Ignavibacteria bacterium]MBI3764876.1 tetratricopeptide repeat protein [Ignavibacteriales bacterium]
MKLSFVVIFLIGISSCSRKSDAILFQEGKGLEEQKDFQQSAARYEEIVDRFAGKAYAESSLSRLAVIYNNELKDSRKAISAYQRYYTMFPSSKQAPTMLFLSGFLYNNELHNLDSARMVYESFLQKYPSHELAPSAKFELENLGKDPNQALETRTGSPAQSDSEQHKKESSQ